MASKKLGYLGSDPQIAWAKLRALRDGAAIASKSWGVELKVPMRDETDQKARKSRSKV